MLFKKYPDKFWDLIANKYASSPISDRVAYEQKIEKIKSFLLPEYCMLDIGCGTGTQCCDLAGSVKQVTGIDFSTKLLKIAEQRKAERGKDNIDYIQASIFDKRFVTGSFDAVMAFYVLHLLEDTDAVFQRIHALLKPGGLFISETSCLGEQNAITVKLLRIIGNLGLIPLINPLTTEQLEKALNQSGFKLLDKTKFGKSNSEYTLIARKESNQ